MVVSYGSIFIGIRCSVKFCSVIIFRGGVVTGERMCFTFVRNTGEAASCLVEGGGQQKGMRSRVIIVGAVLIPGFIVTSHDGRRRYRIEARKTQDPRRN